ncbi:MAG: hypothetical protein ACLR6B_16580 [Blautia sp.]
MDALSVGFTIAEYDWLMALVCSLIIAAVTSADLPVWPCYR